MIRTRCAPSPTGPLHLGHAYSALLAHDYGDAFLIRIEDLDQSRARPQWENQIYNDLTWLGLSWPEPPLKQSSRQAAYEKALDHLWSQDLLYPCTCNRKDIAAAASAPQEGTPMGPDGIIYTGTCRHKPKPKHRPTDLPLRLDIAKAITADLHHSELGKNAGTVTTTNHYCITHIGDPVLQRRDMIAYHLAVTVDDAHQDITHVTRGYDLQDATHIHVVLQNLLGLPTPTYLHHDLIRDDHGKRLAKRDDAKSIATYRNTGLTPEELKSKLPIWRF
ncbi:MAG: tRNA glutamyl-Q(34) synthetase GluQRS [Planktomarina sp.]